MARISHRDVAVRCGPEHYRVRPLIFKTNGRRSEFGRSERCDRSATTSHRVITTPIGNPDRMTSSPSGASQSASKVGAKAEEAADKGQQVERSEWFGALVMTGLIAYGVVHLLIAWIALQVAWTGNGGEASQQGAMAQLASNGIGRVLLWVIAIGLAALVVWQACVAAWGYTEESGSTKVTRRLGAATRAVVYGALCYTAVRTVVEGGQSGDSKDKAMTAKLMSAPAGRILVVVVGLVIVGVGGAQIYRGISKKFTKQLDGTTGRAAVRLGQIGYTAKGVAFGIVGVLFVVAAITFDPNKAGGLDAALRTLRGLAFGSVLLTIVALGLASFGAYCFYWSRHAKR